MKTIIRHHLVCVLTLLAVCWGGLAQEAPPAHQGKVAILANDRILQGDIELVGKQYRIRRSIGQSWLPAEQVRCLCATLEDAFAYLRAQANLNDGAERLRLARWCHLHGLKQQAADEAAAAVKLRPGHAESQRLLKGTQRSLNSDTSTEQPKEESAAEAEAPNLPYNAGSLGLFVNKVQPILMNACARCHACGKGGAFKLTRVYDEGGLGNRKITHQNLMATLAQLNRDRPQTSPLLSYALTLHGHAEMPSLPGRTAPAFRTLEEWAQQARAGLPGTTAAGPPVMTETKNVGVVQPPLSLAVPATPAPGPAAAGASWIAQWQPPVKAGSESPKDQPQPVPAQEASASKPSVEPAATEFAQPRAQPEAAATAPADLFDPLIFNRQMHPGR